MSLPTLHVCALPHTQTTPKYSSCAFSGKILRFPTMMRSITHIYNRDDPDGCGVTGSVCDYEIIHYGVEGAETDAHEQVDVLSAGEWRGLGGEEPGSEQFGRLANVDGELYRRFNARLVPLLRAKLAERDLICLPFGTAHDAAMAHFPHHQKVETGIGYPYPRARDASSFRIYESNAWMHYQLGRCQEGGSDYDFVIPNSYDPSDWTLGTGSGGYLLYFGRLNADKGLPIVLEIAKARPDLPVILCGQGDPAPWLGLPNVEYRPPIHGAGRDKLLGDALCLIAGSRYVEPFAGVVVEASLVGTPALGSAFGAFTETIEHGENGFRCRTLQEWLYGISACEAGDVLASRYAIRAKAVSRYSMWEVARQYDSAFRQIGDLFGAGWFTLAA